MKTILVLFRGFCNQLFQNIFYLNIATFIVGVCCAIKFSLVIGVWEFFVILFILAVLIILIKLKSSLIELIILTFLVLSFFCGVSYLQVFNDLLFSHKINGKFIARVIGDVREVKENGNGSKIVILEVEKILQPSKKTKIKAKRRYTKVNQKYVLENFQNLENYSDIDRRFIQSNQGYADIAWQVDSDGARYSHNYTGRVQISFKGKSFDYKVGDKILVKAFFESEKVNILPSQFNFNYFFNSKLILNRGFAISESSLVAIGENLKISDWFSGLRQEVISRVQEAEIKKRSAAFILAMLTSDRSKIMQSDFKVIRDSGLAHLMSISGLHMSLAAAIFFIAFRFLLTRSEYLALHYNVKKVSAFFAIFSGFLYLQIANAPISAVRAFIAISFIMTAILFDRKTSANRIIFFAAIIIVLINPYSILQIGYQLSFAAIIGIASAREIWSEKMSSYFYSKKGVMSSILSYITQAFLYSFAAQIATSPFLIYHFGNYPVLGILSNIAGIPLVSIITMPLGFLSLLLMTLGCENISLAAMSISLDLLFLIAQNISDTKFALIENAYIKKEALVCCILTLLFFAMFKNYILRCGLFALFTITTFFPYQRDAPDLMIDFSSSNVIINKDSELVFINNPRQSKKLDTIIEFFGNKDFATYKGCKKAYCELRLNDLLKKRSYIDQVLIISKRVSLNKICRKDYDLVINLSKKYQLPECLVKGNVRIINNWDLLKKGNHFIYLDSEKYKIESILD